MNHSFASRVASVDKLIWNPGSRGKTLILILLLLGFVIYTCRLSIFGVSKMYWVKHSQGNCSNYQPPKQPTCSSVEQQWWMAWVARNGHCQRWLHCQNMLVNKGDQKQYTDTSGCEFTHTVFCTYILLQFSLKKLQVTFICSKRISY